MEFFDALFLVAVPVLFFGRGFAAFLALLSRLCMSFRILVSSGDIFAVSWVGEGGGGSFAFDLDRASQTESLTNYLAKIQILVRT